MPNDRRPPRFPPPQFPIRRPALFATTPPAIFPVILGLLGLGLALRKACAATGLPGGLVEAGLGAVAGLWVFAVLAMMAKVVRRPAVLMEDLRPLPGRAGLAAASMGGMALAGVLLPYSPDAALGLVLGSLTAHAALAVLWVWRLGRAAETRVIDPTWHLSFVGVIVAAPVLAQLGWIGAARTIFALALSIAVLIWLASAVQFFRRIPPAPLRPLLAIHLSAAALLSTTASLTGQTLFAALLLGLGAALLLGLLGAARWLLAAGFTPLWGAMTFPLAAYATALLTYGQGATLPGLIVAAASLGVIPIIAWKVLKLWPGGKLAAKTNAATA